MKKSTFESIRHLKKQVLTEKQILEVKGGHSEIIITEGILP